MSNILDSDLLLVQRGTTSYKATGADLFGSIPSVDVSETSPANPSEGDLWWDSSTDSGQLYIYYVDANSSQWVEASSSAGGGGGGGGDLQSVTDAGNTTTNGATFGGGNIELKSWGAATFTGTVVTGNASGNNNFTVTNGITILKRDAAVSNTLVHLGNASTMYGEIRIDGEASFTAVKVGTQGAWDKIRLDANGTAKFAGSVSVGGTADANTISEYEEGTWTPTLGGDSTFNIQWGRYVKIGTFVQCWGGLRPTNVGTGDAKQILGLPFTSHAPSSGTDQGGGSIVWGDGAAVDYVSAVISIPLNNTIAAINVKTAASKTYQANTDFWANGFRNNFYFCYVTAS